VVAGFKVLAGHVAVDPEHFASFSQAPDAVAQTVVEGFHVFAGQVAELPVHLAAF
jgi:hypothetical protein